MLSDTDACQMIQDTLEALFASNRKPWRVTVCKPVGSHGYRAQVAGVVHPNYQTPIQLVTGAPRVTLEYADGNTLITLE